MGCHSLFHLERFCCCCTLRIGSLIIGYLGLMSYSIQVVAGSVHLASLRDEYYVTHNSNNNNNNNNSNITLLYAGSLYVLIARYSSIIIAYNATLALAAASLLWGIHKMKSEFMLPWLVFQMVNFCLVSLVLLVSTISIVVHLGAANKIFYFWLGGVTVIIWLSSYMYACVFSYYKEIKSKEQGDTEENVPPPYITYHEEKKEVL